MLTTGLIGIPNRYVFEAAETDWVPDCFMGVVEINSLGGFVLARSDISHAVSPLVPFSGHDPRIWFTGQRHVQR